MRTIIALAILAVLALPAFAGEGECTGGCPLGNACAEGGCDLDGFDCQNACPIAKQANTRRSLGREAAAVSPVCRKDVAETVALNLRRI